MFGRGRFANRPTRVDSSRFPLFNCVLPQRKHPPDSATPTNTPSPNFDQILFFSSHKSLSPSIQMRFFSSQNLSFSIQLRFFSSQNLSFSIQLRFFSSQNLSFSIQLRFPHRKINHFRFIALPDQNKSNTQQRPRNIRELFFLTRTCTHKGSAIKTPPPSQ